MSGLNSLSGKNANKNAKYIMYLENLPFMLQTKHQINLTYTSRESLTKIEGGKYVHTPSTYSDYSSISTRQAIAVSER